MVDARDLKSLGTQYRAGSIPALGTRDKRGDQIVVNLFFLYAFQNHDRYPDSNLKEVDWERNQ